MQKLIFLLIGGLLVLSARAQDNWDLQKCVDYALQNNVVIKQYELGQQYNENQLNQAKMNRLPNLNAGVNQGFSFGRSLNNDNVYENFNSSSTSFNIGSNVTIYNGSILNNRIKKSGYELEASRYDLETAKDDVILNITSGFLDILFAQELLKVAQKQIDQTHKQIERSNKLAEAGKIAKGDVLQIEAQLAREEQNKVEAQNQLKLAYLSLAQYMELESYHSFAIQTPVLPLIKAEISLNNAVDVFGKAIELRPEIKKAEANLKGAEVDLEIAKGYGLPTLSASASYYNQYLSTNTATMPSFADQFKDNDRKSVGLNLSIPIFNKFQVKNGVENAKLQIENSKLDVEQSKKNLRKIIETAHTNALAAHQSYLASKKAVEAMQISFEYTDEKYNAGMVNSVEYNKAKTDLTVAESELLRAKYQFIFRSKIFDFYNGIPINL